MHPSSAAVCFLMVALIIKSSSGQVDQASMLSVHNAARAEVGAAPLAWDDSLAASAQSYVASCPSDHSALTNADAENLGWGFPTITEQGVADAWVAEKADLSGGVCAAGKVCGHYETIIKPDMKSIGCATKLACTALGKDNAQTWVCHYKTTVASSTASPSLAPASPAPNSTATNAASTNMPSIFGNGTYNVEQQRIVVASPTTNPSIVEAATKSPRNPSVLAAINKLSPIPRLFRPGVGALHLPKGQYGAADTSNCDSQ